MTTVPTPATQISRPPSSSDAASKQVDSWASTLSFLHSEIAVGVERLAKRLAMVMDEQQAPVTGTREPNGYGGIVPRGELKRLLISDWLLLDAEPDEFMRRLVSAELSYLEIERVEPRPPGQLAVLIDSGPRQAGAPRMAHLAALVVLERRARANGVPLRVGFLSDRSVTWKTGALPDLFEAWLSSRTARHPTQADVDRWFDELAADTTLWFLGGDGLAVDHPGVRVERFYAEESGWGPKSAVTLRVSASERTIELDLPARETCLRIIRGRGLRRSGDVTGDRAGTELRFPSFHAAARRLLCRTDRNDELISFGIPVNREAPGGKAKRRRFRGSVIAASFFGQRTVAVVVNQDVVEVEVVGKRLGNVAEMQFDRSTLGLDDDKVEEICSIGLLPVFFLSGMLVLPVGEKWWRLNEHDAWQEPSMADFVATRTIDQPRQVSQWGLKRWVDGRSILLNSEDQRMLLGPNKTHALELNPGEWRTSGGGVIFVDHEADLIGLTQVKGESVLVERSSGGHLIRLHRSVGSSTLTKFSGNVKSGALHPTLPIIAIERSDNTILVVDLETQERLHRIVGGLAG